MSVEKVIMVAQEEFLRKQVAHYLRKKRIDVAECGTIQEAHDKLGNGNYDLMLLDESLPDGNGAEFLVEVNLRPAKPMVVMMGAEGSVDIAVQCMRDGAFDYLIKPFSNEQVEIILHKTEQFAQVLNVNQFLTHQESEDSESEILGESESTEQMRKLIRRVAQTDATVLIQGENGTGKELVARAMHRNSTRKDGPFIMLNCAALPENLVESELFGHEKGSFTGATNKREGRLELAHGGTIFLDEISEMSLPIQSKLLRVLQEREFERVGGNRTVKVDVRVVAATNRKLEQSVEKNEFRQDLYFRLNVVPIYIPPLRERNEDIPLLIEYFLDIYNRENIKTVNQISKEILDILMVYPWPGNVRELENCIERAVVMARGSQFPFTALPFNLRGSKPRVGTEGIELTIESAMKQAFLEERQSIEGEIVDLHTKLVGKAEKALIEDVLKESEFVQTLAARKLGISRNTLHKKVLEHRIPLRHMGEA